MLAARTIAVCRDSPLPLLVHPLASVAQPKGHVWISGWMAIYRMLSLSGSIRSQTPGSIRTALAALRHGSLPARIVSLSALPKSLFRGSIPSTSAPPVTFAPRLLSRLRIDVPVPGTLQGSILGSWRTLTQAGLAPARTCGLARPHYDQGRCSSAAMACSVALQRGRRGCKSRDRNGRKVVPAPFRGDGLVTALTNLSPVRGAAFPLPIVVGAADSKITSERRIIRLAWIINYELRLKSYNKTSDITHVHFHHIVV
jgi:hypothetical protein